MTVEEHLIMFASFKGTPKEKINDEVERMYVCFETYICSIEKIVLRIQSVGLTEKRKSFSKELSGGQKRKLSVAIAFIGGSRIVFLDGL
jgi:ABC-type multidrug transport system ATPase subunit